MDDHQSLAVATDCYHCPGDARPIDRGTHLNRLATFYPACRQCEHRSDVGLLTSQQARQWTQILQRGDSTPRFTREGFDASSLNSLTTADAARFATSLATVVARQGDRRRTKSTVLIGSDGHWATAPLVAAASAALRTAGCHAIDAGASATAPLAACARRLNTDAALWIGNASGHPHGVALRVWGKNARPWSSPGGLDRLQQVYHDGASRPERRGGSLERADPLPEYRSNLQPFYHGLRPLRFVVDTACRPLVKLLERLTAEAACEVLSVGAAPNEIAVLPAVSNTFPEKRLATIARQVAVSEAHFGMWIDGAGESCRLVDQAGAVVDDRRYQRLLASYLRRQSTDASREPMLLLQGDVHREATWGAVESAGAVCAAAGGSYWFAEHAPAPDALMALSLLLTILSESDRALSAVLDAA